jgi:arylformamidase
MEVDACGYLVQKGMKLVGIDSFSVDPFESKDFMCHKVLLGASIVVVEMVDLKDVEPGDYNIFCLPLKIFKGDGAPARVILEKLS